MEPSDAVLWSRSRAGDADAFGLLFERHASTIYNYCFRRVGDWAAAEDLLSIVFLEAWRRRSKELPPDKALPWLFGIATNVVRNRRRAERRHATALARVPLSPPHPRFEDSSDERIDDERQARRALALLARLPRSQQDVFVLCAWMQPATTDWLTGSPAPRSVVADFGSYARQLGFDPEPGRAVRVAADGDTILYATTHEQGGYCLLASATWKRPGNHGEGGTCISSAQAAAPLIAGLVGASSSPSGGQTYLIAGRTTDRRARTIRFRDPGGATITRLVGSSGFFLAAIHTATGACASGGWTPTFSVLGADGKERSSATITLGSAPSGSSGACVFAPPHA